MEKRIALVTGANKGLGRETARQLAERGVIVFIGARDSVHGQEVVEEMRAKGLSANFVYIDMTKPESFEAAAKAIDMGFGKLDILVNNAGVLLDRDYKPSETPMEIWRETMEVNVLGLIGLTQAMLPLLRKSDAGRIVNLSSNLASMAMHSDPHSDIYNSKPTAYDVSKAAVNSWTIHLAHELRDTPIKVNAAHPGWVKTDMGGDKAPLELIEGAKTSVELALLGPDGPTGTYSHRGKVIPW